MSIKKQIIPTLAALFCLVCCNGAKGQEESAAPAVPSGISLREATESSLAIQWNVSEGATSYDWKLLKDGAEAKSGHTSKRPRPTVFRYAASPTARLPTGPPTWI